MQLAPCSVQCEVCSMQFVVRSVQFAMCSLLFAVCIVQCAVCSVQCSNKAPTYIQSITGNRNSQAMLEVSTLYIVHTVIDP